MRVVHFHRRPMPGNFSVENVFRDVRQHMPESVDVQIQECGHPSKGVLPRVRNILGVRKVPGALNHVTGDVTYLALRMDPRRTICTFLDCMNLERLRGWRRAVLKKFWFDIPIRRSALITVISRATGDRMIELTGCPAGKLRVVHVPVADRFQPAPREFNATKPTILHVGTKENKNLERHAEAICMLSCRLVVIGPMTTAQIGLVERLGIEYENHTNLSAEEMLRQYQACDLLLFASTYEGFGMPIVEANAIGRPVITSTLWSMPEVADGAALLVDPLSVKSIRAGVERLIADAGLREELVVKGFANAQRFRAEVIAQQYADIYAELAEWAGLIDARQ